MTATSEETGDLYAILEVARDASPAAILAAFRRLAAQHHPDRNPGDSKAARRFKRVNSAFQVLSDPVQRAAYDDLTRSVHVDDFDSGPGTADPPPFFDSNAEQAHVPPSAQSSMPPFATNAPPPQGANSERCARCGTWMTRGTGRCFNCGSPVQRRPESFVATLGKVVAWILAIGALVVGVGGYLIYLEIQKESRDRAANLASVDLDSLGSDRCIDGMTRIRVVNNSKKYLKDVSFEIEGYEDGRSDNVFGFLDELTWTHVIAPGKSASACYRLPKFVRPITKEVYVKLTPTTVNHYEPGEFIPVSASSN